MSSQTDKENASQQKEGSPARLSPACRHCGKAVLKGEKDESNKQVCDCRNGPAESGGDGSIRLGPVPEEAFRRSPSPRPAEPSARPLKYEIVSIHEKHGEFRKAIPCMPFAVALFCCLFNAVLPGTGTLISALTVLCGCRTEQETKSRALGYNLVAALLQLLTAPLIVGWVWSVHWGIIFVNLSMSKALQESETSAVV